MGKVVSTHPSGVMSKIGDFVHKALNGNPVDYVRPPAAAPMKFRTPKSESEVVHGKNNAVDVSKMPKGTIIGKGVGP